jgi:catechol-2,3-dioxygenase
MIEGISAITLGTHDMQRAVQFYRSLGFDITYGGEVSSFTSFRAGTGYLNLIAQPDQRRWSWWDAEWGERYFHLTDPDGHELSFARPLRPAA